MSRNKIIWKTVSKKVNDLVPLSINPRKITKENKDKLIKSLEKFNLAEIPAINLDGIIISGHQRIHALKIIGRGEEFIDVRIPNRNLSEEEVKEYNLLSNTHSGQWDLDILNEFFDDIDLTKDILNDNTFDIKTELVSFYEKKEIKTKPFLKNHILISYDISKSQEILEILNNLYEIEGIEIEQSSN